MISGANDKELMVANARANIILKLDNTSTYESWLIIDTYIEYLENKEQSLIKYLEDKIENERKIQKFLYENKNTKLVEKATTNSAIRTYQEILDKIRSDE